jgi:hypothetical protein
MYIIGQRNILIFNDLINIYGFYSFINLLTNAPEEFETLTIYRPDARLLTSILLSF